MNNRRVLIADDEITIQKVLCRLLAQQGYEVESASSAADAEKMLDTFEPNLLISDYVMPGEDGLSFLSRLKDSHPTLIRVLLTGFADVRTAVQAINQAHVHYFVVKPFEADEFLQVVADLLTAFPAHPREDKTQDAIDGSDPTPDHEALDRLRKAHPGIDAVRRNTKGCILIDDEPGCLAPPSTRDFELVPPLDDGPQSPIRIALPSKQPQREPTFFRNLKAEHPSIADVQRDAEGYILIEDEELASFFETNEYERPSLPRKAPEHQLYADRRVTGAQPLDDWFEKTRDYSNPTQEPSDESQSEPVFDDVLLKLIGK